MNKRKIITVMLEGTIVGICGAVGSHLANKVMERRIKEEFKTVDFKIDRVKEDARYSRKQCLDIKNMLKSNEDKTMTSLSIKELISETVMAMEIGLEDRSKQNMEYFTNQMDEVFERLEKAEEYIQTTADTLLGDKAEEVQDKVFNDSEDISELNKVIGEVSVIMNKEFSAMNDKEKKEFLEQVTDLKESCRGDMEKYILRERKSMMSDEERAELKEVIKEFSKPSERVSEENVVNKKNTAKA